MIILTTGEFMKSQYSKSIPEPLTKNLHDYSAMTIDQLLLLELDYCIFTSNEATDELIARGITHKRYIGTIDQII